MIIPLLVLLVGIGLLSGDEDSRPASSAAAADALVNSADAATDASAVGKTKPRIQVPKAPPPAKLEATDLVDGTGAQVKAGEEVTIHYVLLLQKNGKEVDSTWGGKPFSFELGGGTATAGWERGIEGMREGGRRELVAPADLSYGKAGVPPTIGPNEALVSVIDLLKIKPASQPGRTPAP